MHVHVHVSRDTPHASRCPPTHLPPPQSRRKPQGAAGSPNNWNFISPELIKIIQFCFKNLYLWTFLNSSRLMLITLDTPHPPVPPPWSRRRQNLKNAIKRERIEIIEFCLEICDSWALLHTYRLGLICRWRGVPSQMALLCFEPKKVHVFHSCNSLDKKFLVFALDPTRPCLDWQLSRFLTSQPIYEPFKFDLKWRPKCKIWLKSQFAKEPSTIEKFEILKYLNIWNSHHGGGVYTPLSTPPALTHSSGACWDTPLLPKCMLGYTPLLPRCMLRYTPSMDRQMPVKTLPYYNLRAVMNIISLRLDEAVHIRS